MKYLIPAKRYFHLLLLFGLLHNTSNAQTLNKHYLSDDIENLANSNPNQALKIAQYLLSKTNTSDVDKSRINYLIPKAYMAKGDYSSALNFLYVEKNYEPYLSEEQKINIDISNNRSKSVDEFAGEEIDYVLTVCDNAKENCPYFPAKTKLVHHSFEDPAEILGNDEIRLEAFRKIRDEIQKYLENDFVKILKAE